MNFKEICNSINNVCCVISVKKTNDSYDEIRIVDGNEKYIASFNMDTYKEHQFIPNSIYTKYLERNLNFEEYCYRSAVKKELLHSYAYPEHFKMWLHMLFIPLEYETKELSYCLYIMEINDVFEPEKLANTKNDTENKILAATLQLANTSDFEKSIKNVTKEIRKLCFASFCCILLLDEEKEELKILASDRDLNSKSKHLIDYNDDSFYDLVVSWDDTISDSNCIIINDSKGMDYLKDKNYKWYESLSKNNINSLVLFRLKSNNNQIGYMWVSDFKVDNTPLIKEMLEITTFILGSEIANHLLVDKLTKLSSIDLLTGIYNRNKLNNYMDEIKESNESLALVFLDINGLKVVNDRDGHLAGDNLIKRAANTLKNVFKNKYIFRAGGDEFVVIIKNESEAEIKKYLDKLNIVSKNNNVSFSVGYSITDNSCDIDKILKEADSKMYINKRKYYELKKQ